MTKLVLMSVMAAAMANAGVFSVAKHVVKDAASVVAYQAKGVFHAVKHAGSDVKSVAK